MNSAKNVIRHVLFVSPDSASFGVGSSQALRVAVALEARTGVKTSILSMDKSERRAVQRVKQKNFEWRQIPFREGGGVKSDLANGLRLFWEIRKFQKVDLIVARSFQTAFVSRILKTLHQTPYIYDTRGCWVASKARQRPVAIRKLLNFVDCWVIKGANCVITLTELYKKEIERRHQKRVICIPTLTDFEKISIQRKAGQIRPEPKEMLLILKNSLVIAYVGSINEDYLVDFSLRLVAKVLILREDAVFLCLVHQVEKMHKLVRAVGLDESRVIVTSTSEEEIAQWLSYVDWGLLLLRSDPDKIGSMPTKLGEFLAAGVRPVCHGCNPEVEDWVLRAGSGIVINTSSTKDLEEAAREIADGNLSFGMLEKARETAEGHFSLRVGIEKYRLAIFS